jgi:alkylation response protein AidB-like acyl-CoA dehydrogenase
MIATGNGVSAGYMRDTGAREFFADPTAPTAGIGAPTGSAVRVPGGVRVSGRWPFASGITHSSWVWAGCFVTEDGRPRMTPDGPEIVHVSLPVSAIEIHDTWRVSGLCGTGSHDFSAADVFVPDHHVFLLFDSANHRPEPLYRIPALTMFVLLVPCVSLGVARSAIDELGEVAQGKTPTMRTAVLADMALVQIEMARAEASLGAARAFLFDTAEDVWRTVCDGRSPDRRQLAMVRLAATQAAETAATITRTASALAGGSAIYTRSSLQRHARDAEAVTHHFTVAPYTWEDAGRVLLGRRPMVGVF